MAGNGDDLQASVAAIAAELGDDRTFLAPPEPHFDVLTLGVAAASALLWSFLRGMSEVATEKATELGRHVGAWIIGRIEAYFGRGEVTSTGELGSAVAGAAEAIQDRSPHAVEQIAQTVEHTVAEYLAGEGMPAARARHLAVTVRREALARLKAAGG